MPRVTLSVERAILASEQDRLPFPECQVRLAENPPFYRCSCGASYANPGEHPETRGAQDPEPDTRAQYPFNS